MNKRLLFGGEKKNYSHQYSCRSPDISNTSKLSVDQTHRYRNCRFSGRTNSRQEERIQNNEESTIHSMASMFLIEFHRCKNVHVFIDELSTINHWIKIRGCSFPFQNHQKCHSRNEHSNINLRVLKVGIWLRCYCDNCEIKCKRHRFASQPFRFSLSLSRIVFFSCCLRMKL